jgi:hypothetical protein
VLALAGGLIGWRLWWSLRHIPPPPFSRSVLTSRPMFYWNPDGDHLQINRELAGVATWLLIVAAVVALIGWAWRPAWVPVVAFVSIAVACLRLGTTTYSAPHAQLNAVATTGAAVGLIVLNYVAARAYLRVRSRRRVRHREVIPPNWATGMG